MPQLEPVSISYSFPVSNNMFNSLCFLLFIFLILPSVNSVYFNLPRFDPLATDVLYQGDAVPSAGSVELTNIDYKYRVGWVTYSKRLRIWDSGSGKVSDFSTRFSFTIDTQNRSSYGHGVVFFLASEGFQIPPNSGSGFLGLFNTTTTDSSQNQIVTVEFDTFANTIDGWDPPYQHVGINNNSISSVVNTPWNASFHSGDSADVRIDYNASTKNLSVSWTYQKTRNPRENSSLFYLIDLSKVLPEYVTVGFSASTGENVEKHFLGSWEFNSSLKFEERDGKNSKRTGIIVGITVSAGCVIAGMIVGFLFIRRRELTTRKSPDDVTSFTDDFERGAGPRRFSYQDLVSATNNFSNERKLGEGGFGAVYKGYIIDLDAAIAVKKFSRGSKQGKKEYITEVKTISQLRHRNLVQLIGWCHEKGEFLLVYEFMPNGSLDNHLFGKKAPLVWSARYKIVLGLASGLLYLHEEWEQCVLHRDIKSSNIMLDSSFNVKLGDFGLARLMDHELGSQTTGIAGTLGYLAPECINTGRASKESDVYSFGVVVLEIVTGRKAREPIAQASEMSLVEWVWSLYAAKNLTLAVDSKLHKDYDLKQVECLMIVGLWCANPDRSLRPSIRQAIQVINSEAPLPNIPESMPVPSYMHVATPSVSSGEPSITCSSIALGR